MSCLSCKDIEQHEGIPPGCSSDSELGCLLPGLSDEAARALHLRSMIVRLRGLVSADAVMRIMAAGRADLMLMAEAQDAIQEMADDKNGN